jgi:hypothetical protein
MNSRRVYFLLLGLIGLLVIGVIGGAYGVNSMLQTKSDKLVAVKLHSQVLSSQETGLAKEKREVIQYTDLNDIAKSIVPQDKDQAEAVREISNLASDSGITKLSSITFPLSTLGGLNSSVSTTTTTPTATKSTGLTQLTPAKGVSGVYQLQITITESPDSPVPYSTFLTFLGKLEQNRRTAQVGSISLTPDKTTPSNVGFILIVNEFIKP